MSKSIPLVNTVVSTIVDDDWYEKLNKYRWYLHYRGYAYRTEIVDGKKRNIYMHRLIMDFPEGKLVDHENKCRLDNREENLRICNQSQNSMNKNKTLNKTASKYKGVSKSRNRWRARILYNKKAYNLGTFNTEEEAALAYNKKATELFGEFAALNVVV